MGVSGVTGCAGARRGVSGWLAGCAVICRSRCWAADAGARLHLGYVPDGARRVNGRGANDGGVRLVPVERRERRAELGVLILQSASGAGGQGGRGEHTHWRAGAKRRRAPQVGAARRPPGRVGAGGCAAHVVQQAVQTHGLVVLDRPEPQVVSCGGQQVAPSSDRIWYPHDLRGGVRVLEAADFLELELLLVELDHAHRVAVLLLEAADGEPEALVCPHAPVHAVDEPWRGVRVDLLALGAARSFRHRRLARVSLQL